jgi:pimeloyl-ACP methyl ester carboxylesterase
VFAKHLSIEKFSATDGTLLYGLLARPVHSGPRTAVLHIHGLTGSFYGSSAIEELSVAITNSGMAFFSIETRGSYIVEEFTRKRGERTTDFFAGAAMERFEDSVHDIDGAVKFLEAKGFRSIFISGHSTGCQKAVYYAAKKRSKQVRGLVLLAPVDDYNFDRRHYGRRFQGLAELARSIAKKNPDGLMPKNSMPDTIISASRFLSTADPSRPEARLLNYMMPRMDYAERIRVPVLAVFGDNDMYMKGSGITPGLAAARLKESCRHGFKALTIKGADHGFHGKRRLLARKVADWMLKNA